MNFEERKNVPQNARISAAQEVRAKRKKFRGNARKQEIRRLQACSVQQDRWPFVSVQSAQIHLFWFRILVFLQFSSFCLYIYVLPAEIGSQIRPKQAVRQFAPSLTKKKATNLKRKSPARFSLDQ